MGGIDLCDMILESYRVKQRSIEYCMRILYYWIGIGINNSWLLYRRHIEPQNITKKISFL